MSRIEQSSHRAGPRAWPVLVIFLPPALLVFTVFVFLPMAEASWYSFFNWNGLGRPERFIALKNYRWIFENATFWRAVFNNLLVIVVSLALQLPLALGVALWVSGRAWGSVGFRMIFFLPYVLADIVAGLMWRFLFDGDYGLARAITDALEVQPVYLLASAHWAFTSVLVVIMWKYFGFHMMLYVAGLQSVDKTLLEAAEMDGANAWQRFRYITLPALGPMIRLCVFFSVIGVAAIVRLRRFADHRRPVRHDSHDGVVPLLFWRHADARRFWRRRRRRAVHRLRAVRARLQTLGDAR